MNNIETISKTLLLVIAAAALFCVMDFRKNFNAHKHFSTDNYYKYYSK